MSEALLSVKRLKVSYGGIHAVKGIDFTVNAGEQVTLIGANGAGKTSSLRALTGLQPFEGDILFDGPFDSRHGAAPLAATGAGDGAGRSRHFHPPDGARKPAAGRLCAA